MPANRGLRTRAVAFHQNVTVALPNDESAAVVYPTARRSRDEAVVLLETPNRPLAGQYSP